MATLVSVTDGRTWAYSGVEITAALDLSVDRAFDQLPQVERLARALETQQYWLESLISPDNAAELRFIGGGGLGAIECALLCRFEGPDEATATQRAARWAATARSGQHIAETVEIDESRLRYFLKPLTPGPDGRAEVRKRFDSSVPNRPDAGVERYWRVSPYRTVPRSWAPLLGAFSGLSDRTMLTVSLRMRGHQLEIADRLDQLATWYGRLAIEGESRQGQIYSGSRRLAPEAFAIESQQILDDAARRYRSGALSMRIAVATEGTLHDGLVNMIGSTISPSDNPNETAAQTTHLVSAAFEVVRPSPDNHRIFDANLAALHDTAWQQPALPAPFQVLAEIATTVDSREALAAFRLPIAETGVLDGFAVKRPEFRVSVSHRSDTDRVLTLGAQVGSDTGTSRLGLPLDDLTMHAFVAGITGSGKTTTMLSLLDQISRHGVPWMVIEPVNSTGNDYRWFLNRPGHEHMIVLTAGDDSTAPLRLNPLEVPEGATVGEHLSALLASFDAAFSLWDPLPAIYRSALEQCYFEAGFSLEDRGGHRRWPTVRDLLREMKLATDDLDYSGEVRSNIIAASRVRIEQLLTGPMRSVFDCTTSTPVDQMLARPCVVELARVGASNEKEVAFVIAILLTMIAELRRGEPQSRRLRHVIVVEEAHKLLRKSEGGNSEEKGDAGQAASQLFANLLAEVRKAGQGIIVVDQDPAKLVADAYKNTNLKIMHRLPAKADRELIGDTMRFDEDHLSEAAGLARFHAFVHAEGYDRPGLIRIDNLRSDDDGPPPDTAEIRRRFIAIRSESPQFDRVVLPYGACDGCQSSCQHRAWAHSRTSRRATLNEFWESVGGIETDRSAGLSKVDELVRRVSESDDPDQWRCVLVHLSLASFDSNHEMFVNQAMSRLTSLDTSAGLTETVTR